MPMPIELETSLIVMPSLAAKEVWDYLDVNPNAVHEMIKTLVESHKDSPIFKEEINKARMT